MIDHNAPVSAYMQLMSHFSVAIARGKYKPGDKLPSESAMCREFGVSRTTVRQALQLLTQQGLIFSAHGRGTFVKMPAIRSELTKITSFGQVLQQKGLSGHTRIHGYCPRTSDVHPDLGADAACLELLGYISDAPAVYYRSYFLSQLGEKMWQAAKTAAQSSTAFSTYDLYDKIGVPCARVEQTIRAISASEALSEILNIPAGMALITLDSVYYGADGTALEYKTGYYRSDIYSFNVQRDI